MQDSAVISLLLITRLWRNSGVLSKDGGEISDPSSCHIILLILVELILII